MLELGRREKKLGLGFAAELWYEGRKDWRAVRSARMGLKSNWPSWLPPLFSLLGEELDIRGDPQSTGGVPIRMGGVPP